MYMYSQTCRTCASQILHNECEQATIFFVATYRVTNLKISKLIRVASGKELVVDPSEVILVHAGIERGVWRRLWLNATTTASARYTIPKSKQIRGVAMGVACGLWGEFQVSSVAVV